MPRNVLLARETRSVIQIPGFCSRQSAPVAPATFDAAARSLRVVACTEQPAQVVDWDRWELVDEILLMSGAALPANGRCPLLNSHDRSSVECVLGSAGNFSRSQAGGFDALECEIVFAGTGDGQNTATLFQEGHLTDVSIGYRVLESTWIPESQTQTINGKSYAGPVKVATRWELKELSATPIGADSLAKARAENHGGNSIMNEKMRKRLEAMGLRSGATDKEAFDFLAKMADAERGAVLAETTATADPGALAQADTADGQRAAAAQAAPAKPVMPTMTDEQARAAADRAIKDAEERARAETRAEMLEIRESCDLFGLDAAFSNDLIKRNLTLDQARAAIIARMAADRPAVGRIEFVAAERDKVRAAAVDGLCLRAGVQVVKPVDGSNDYRNMTCLRLGEDCLSRIGVSVRGMNPMEIVSLALRGQMGEGSSDFPNIMSALVNKTLTSAYQTFPSTYQIWCHITSANDFKNVNVISMSESPDLDEIGEHGEYKTAKFAEDAETYHVVTYGKKFMATRKALINDDLSALTRVPRAFGVASVRKVNDLVYRVLAATHLMNDGKTLFHADHKNLASTGADLGTTALDAARTAMRLQTALLGETAMNIEPSFLIVPAAWQTQAEIILRSMALPDPDMSAGVHNPWGNSMRPVVEGRLDALSGKAFYLATDPAVMDTVEVAFLGGQQAPYLEERTSFDSDGLEWKVRIDVGAKATNWRGLYKVPAKSA